MKVNRFLWGSQTDHAIRVRWPCTTPEAAYVRLSEEPTEANPTQGHEEAGNSTVGQGAPTEGATGQNAKSATPAATDTGSSPLTPTTNGEDKAVSYTANDMPSKIRVPLSDADLGDAQGGDGKTNKNLYAIKPIELGTKSASEVNAEMKKEGLLPAWLVGTNVITESVPAGRRYRMVVSQTQVDMLVSDLPAFGWFATTTDIPSQIYARNKLVILEEFKGDVSWCVLVETTDTQLTRTGITGPFGKYAGGVPQTQFLGERNLKLVGKPWKLPVEEEHD
jgi:hypothetical protein